MEWIKLVAHGIPLLSDPFHVLKSFKEEVKTFNSIEVFFFYYYAYAALGAIMR